MVYFSNVKNLDELKAEFRILSKKLLLKKGSFDQIKKEIEIEHIKTSAIIFEKYKEHKKELNNILTNL